MNSKFIARSGRQKQESLFDLSESISEDSLLFRANQLGVIREEER
jgi:hypothetical protein